MDKRSNSTGRGCAVALVLMILIPIVILGWITVMDWQSQNRPKPQADLFSAAVLAFLKSGGELDADHHAFAGTEALCLFGAEALLAGDTKGCPQQTEPAIGILKGGGCRLYQSNQLGLTILDAGATLCRDVRSGFRLFVVNRDKTPRLMLGPPAEK